MGIHNLKIQRNGEFRFGQCGNRNVAWFPVEENILIAQSTIRVLTTKRVSEQEILSAIENVIFAKSNDFIFEGNLNRQSPEYFEKALNQIDAYFNKEFFESKDVYNYYRVELGETELLDDETNEEIGYIHVYADLFNYCLVKEVDDYQVSTIHYRNQNDFLNSCIKQLDFDDLVSLTSEEIQRFKRWKES